MSTSSAHYNAQIIGEFRANKGHAGGMWEGTPLLLLHHTGAKSGVSRVNPVAYLPDDRRYLIWAANGGAPNNPDWYHNLMAHPNTRIEVGSETIDVVAEEAASAERERLFARAAERYLQLAEVARKTNRVIPMIVLAPRGSASVVRPRAMRTHRDRPWWRSHDEDGSG
jgi:deazaflavin-dependent oxidoreductase (nitroreductase family)